MIELQNIQDAILIQPMNFAVLQFDARNAVDFEEPPTSGKIVEAISGTWAFGDLNAENFITIDLAREDRELFIRAGILAWPN
ncbi:MAG: Uncharacterised protein [Hyphomonas sp. TMED17]|nr:MAG: Uncharacterised protein [Hyphomonas sp. TMED17]